MKDYYSKHSTYFKGYEEKQENKEFFRQEVNSVLNYIYDEIEFSKKHINYKNGLEQNYNKDIESYKININFYKQSFKGENIKIKYPKRISSILKPQANYLEALGVKKNDIVESFSYIRESFFKSDSKVQLKATKQEIKDWIESSCKLTEILTQKGKMYDILQNKHSKKTHEEIIKILDKTEK